MSHNDVVRSPLHSSSKPLHLFIHSLHGSPPVFSSTRSVIPFIRSMTRSVIYLSTGIYLSSCMLYNSRKKAVFHTRCKQNERFVTRCSQILRMITETTLKSDTPLRKVTIGIVERHFYETVMYRSIRRVSRRRL